MHFELKNTAKSGRVVYTANGIPKEIKAGETRSIDLTDGQAMNLKRLADQKSPLQISAKTEDAKAILDRAVYQIRKDANSRRLPPPNNDGLSAALAANKLPDPAPIKIIDELKEETVERSFAEEFGDKPRRGRK